MAMYFNQLSFLASYFLSYTEKSLFITILKYKKFINSLWYCSVQFFFARLDRSLNFLITSIGGPMEVECILTYVFLLFWYFDSQCNGCFTTLPIFRLYLLGVVLMRFTIFLISFGKATNNFWSWSIDFPATLNASLIYVVQLN